ncbi:MAG: glutamate-5-semialdehyde dehydrogenase [Treponema sp.]|nr:glutamate-5-semialdehyde dehydrogenase [Treponema sp.]
MNLEKFYGSLRRGANFLVQLSSKQKNDALYSVSHAINNSRKKILEANAIDVKNAREKGMSESLIDRLVLNDKRIDDILESIKIIIAQTDPIGTSDKGWYTPEGLQIRQMRVPLGVCAIIYESRPNVTVDAFALAYKSGNAILLRGSSSALNSNRALVKAIKEGLKNCEQNGCGIPEAIELADSGDREEVSEILNAVGKIDVVLPRGGANLIKTVVENARVPVIETGSGICHIFVDKSANLEKAVKIVENAKLQRPGVCNAMEVLLVHEKIACEFLPMVVKNFAGRVQLRCDEKSFNILNSIDTKDNDFKIIKRSSESDFDTEFLDYILAIKIVCNVEEAVEHINTHNTKHSESIVTESVTNAKIFQKCVDAACVYVNASTRFTDGGVFGYGAELGISTQKLHVRGPMGLTALTSTKYLIDGDGHVR